MTRRGVWLVAAGVVGAALVGAGTWAALHSPERRLREYVAAMRAAGEPTSLKEIVDPPPRDSENAAIEIEQAIAWVDSTLGTETAWPKAVWFFSDDGSVAPGDQPPAMEFAERLRPFAQRVKAALERPRFRFSEDLQLYRVGVLFRALVRFAPSPSEQMDACRTWTLFAARLDGRWPQNFITPCPSELKLAVESGRWAAVEARSRLDEALALLVERQRDQMDRELFTRRVGAVGVHLMYLEAARRDGLLNRVRRALGDYRDWNELDAEDVLAEAECLRALRDSPDLTFVKYRKAWLEACKPAVRLSIRQLGYDKSWANGTCTNWAGVCAEANLARLALASAEHRAKHGDFPASLDELRWAFPDGVPLDPFTDAPFVYESTSAGVRIKSRGLFADQTPGPNTGGEFVWELKR